MFRIIMSSFMAYYTGNAVSLLDVSEKSVFSGVGPIGTEREGKTSTEAE